MKSAVRILISLLFLATGLYAVYTALALPAPGSWQAQFVRAGGALWTYTWLPPMTNAVVFLSAALLFFRFGERILGPGSQKKWFTILLLAVGGLYALGGIVSLLISDGSASFGWNWRAYASELIARLIAGCLAVFGAVGLLRGYTTGMWILFAVACLGTLSLISEGIARAVDPEPYVRTEDLVSAAFGVILMLLLRWLHSDLEATASVPKGLRTGTGTLFKP